jgi:LysM repeat protein
MGKRPGVRWHRHAAPTRVQALAGLALPMVAAAGLAGHSYTVKPGDTLSGIAQREYGNAADWQQLFAANRGTVSDPDLIYPGQVLEIPQYQPRHASPGLAPAAAAPPGGSSYMPAAVPEQAADTSSGGYPGGAFGQCVVARESGGNAQVMNSTGHYGLYQFSEPTWVEYGGAAADFGHASVSEQDHVFANALAAGGQFNWSAYDGCLAAPALR